MYRQRVEWCRRAYKEKPAEALARADERQHANEDWYIENHVLNCEPDQVAWSGLGDLAERDPEAAVRRWEEIRAAARDELASGHRAARMSKGYSCSPWDRARFLAVRDALIGAWQPRDGLELLLIDTLAQAQWEAERWLQLGTQRLEMGTNRHRREAEERDAWLPPRVSDWQAQEQAMAMADRWNRVFLRTLRALRDLRRYSPVVNIQAGGQVNIGALQAQSAAVAAKVYGGEGGVVE